MTHVPPFKHVNGHEFESVEFMVELLSVKIIQFDMKSKYLGISFPSSKIQIMYQIDYKPELGCTWLKEGSLVVHVGPMAPFSQRQMFGFMHLPASPQCLQQTANGQKVIWINFNEWRCTITNYYGYLRTTQRPVLGFNFHPGQQ